MSKTLWLAHSNGAKSISKSLGDRVRKLHRRIDSTAKIENATKQAPLDRSAADSDPAMKDLLLTNATKQEYCSRSQLTELTGAFQAVDFGTPISIGGRRGGRPKGGSRGETIVPDRIDERLALHAAEEGYPRAFRQGETLIQTSSSLGLLSQLAYHP
jgi:hypothetical protein